TRIGRRRNPKSVTEGRGRREGVRVGTPAYWAALECTPAGQNSTTTRANYRYDFSMSSSVSTAGVVSFEEARRIVEEHATKVRAGVAAGAVDCDVQAGGAQVSGVAAGEVEVVDLLAGRGRV